MVGDRINQAFQTMPRRWFLPADARERADIDAPLSIGYRQTNSQPSTVRRMLEWLDVQPGDNVLDVGSGSGWTTALLSFLVGLHGYVTALEIIPELMEIGEENCLKAGVTNAEFHIPGAEFGWPYNSPYERILVSAAADRLPEELKDQLLVGGRAVIPVQNSILVVDKTKNGLDIQEHYGFRFVPLR